MAIVWYKMLGQSNATYLVKISDIIGSTVVQFISAKVRWELHCGGVWSPGRISSG